MAPFFRQRTKVGGLKAPLIKAIWLLDLGSTD